MKLNLNNLPEGFRLAAQDDSKPTDHDAKVVYDGKRNDISGKEGLSQDIITATGAKKAGVIYPSPEDGVITFHLSMER